MASNVRADAEHNGSAEPAWSGESFFRAVTHYSSDIILVVDQDGAILYANQATERFLGYQPAVLIGTSAFDYIIPEELPRAINDFARALAISGEPIPNSFHVRHRDGSQRLLEGIGTNLIGNPDIRGFVMNVRDVTDREKTELALRESERKFRDLAEKSPVGVYVAYRGAFRYVNARFAEIHGYSIEDLIQNCSVKDLAHPDDWPRIEENISREIEDSMEPYHAEIRAVKKSGEVIDIEVYATMTSYEGRTGVIGTVLDVSRRKRMESILKSSNRTLEHLVEVRTSDLQEANRKLEEEIGANDRIREAVIRAKQEWERTFDSVPDPIGIIDRGHNIVRLNTAMANRLGAHPREAVGAKCHELIHGTKEPPPSCPHLLLLADGLEHASEMYIERWNGTYDITVSPLREGNGNLAGCVHIARDITERRKQRDWLEQTVLERTAELSKKNRELTSEISERRRAETALRQKAEELQRHSVKLEELNVALRVIIEQRDADRADMEKKIMANIKHLLLPHLELLKRKKLDPECGTVLEILENNVGKITSSFSQKLTSNHLNLTPAEMKVADLVKEGKSIKEIAELLNVSHFTVDLHRHNIRKKLGLKSRKINLKTYLMSIS